MAKFETISSTIIHTNPYWVYKMNEYEMPNGNFGKYYFVETPGSVFIVPRDENGNFIMVKQFRYLNSRFSIEFPGGGIKNEFNNTENAQKELNEEAGIYASKLTKIGEFNPYNGVTSEICHVYFAEDLSSILSTPDAGEEFSIMKLNESEIDSLIKSGEIWDGMTIVAWNLYKLYVKGD